MLVYEELKCPDERRAAVDNVYADDWLIHARNSGFSWRLSALSFADMTVAFSQASRNYIEHRISDCDRYHLHIANAPQKIFVDSRKWILNPGDILLTGSPIECSILNDYEYESISLSLPGDVLRRHFPDLLSIVGKPFRCSDGVTKIAAELLWAMWPLACRGDLLGFGPRISGQFLNLLATSRELTDGLPNEDTAARRTFRHNLIAYAERNLEDPELRLDSISLKFGISPRYVQMLFEGEAETICTYIRRRRLERCYEDLRDCSQRKRTITEIAFRWGFNSSAHFSRCFRSHFAISPREVRKQILS